MLRRFPRRWSEFARRKRLVILLAALAPLVLRAALLPWIPRPHPRVQDEFSHLLIADTFAHGRLVNPVHPMWVHFETMHELVRPVYASVFPVAHGITMAAAQVVTGHRWPGVWLGIALMCGSITWMLYGWVPPRWALAGAVLVVARFGVLSYWMNSYYGGAVAAAGGALVLGALPRIRREGAAGFQAGAAVFAIGIAILANSRPYEGALFALPALAALAWVLRDRTDRVRAILPAAIILGVTACAMSYYCAAVTHHPFQLPYAYYRANFTMAPHFIFQSPRPEPVYHHRILHEFHTVWEMGCYDDARANRAPHGLFSKAVSYWRFYLGPVLTLPFFALPWLWKRRRVRLLLLFGAAFAAGLAVEVWHAPHYAAPALGVCMLLVIEGLRGMRAAFGWWAPAAMLAAAVCTPVVGGSSPLVDGRPRADILDRLRDAGGRHLVMVRYQRRHDVGDEWVYNAADINASPVVWAREMDPTSNRELVDYFRGRKAWLLEPDISPPRLTPYDPANLPDPPFRFVKLGTPEITVLRSTSELRQRILSQSGAAQRSCDLWNYAFLHATGVEAPDPALGCFPRGDRGQDLPFEAWFGWLMTQR